MTATTTTQPLVPGSTEQPHSRKPAVAAIGLVVAALAVSGGVVLGQHLTAGPATVTPTAPGYSVTFPSDWQLYRAGERGDALPSTLGDWMSYRSGER